MREKVSGRERDREKKKSDQRGKEVRPGCVNACVRVREEKREGRREY